MGATGVEIEVKLPFDSPSEALELLRRIGARLTRARHFEDNVLFENPSLPLKSVGKMLRLRRAGPRVTLTYKAPLDPDARHKVRQEEEIEVADAGALTRILAGLGFSPSYRYQKFRTTFEVPGLDISLDETPLGCFVELEGEPEAIDRTAAGLGFGPERYVKESYREIHEARAAASGVAPGDLLLAGAGECPVP